MVSPGPLEGRAHLGLASLRGRLSWPRLVGPSLWAAGTEAVAAFTSCDSACRASLQKSSQSPGVWLV